MSLMGMYSSIGGRVLSHYEVGVQIGKGAMGHVYKGHDMRLDRPVAIKVLPHWARGDPQARERLVREARAASALNHPNIVTVYEIARYKGVDLMVMEYVEGKTLADLIPSRGLPVPKALGLALQMADALSAAHAAHILHRDLKPTNVMVTEDDRLKLLDFGLAQLVTLAGHGETQQTKPDQPGTRIYMSPEQLKGHPGDPRSEIFSAGLVFYQMLSGKHPFGPGTRDEVTQAIRTKPPAALPPKVPPVLANLVYRCLAQTPEQRFESMHELLIAVTECYGKPIAEVPVPPRIGRWLRITSVPPRFARFGPSLGASDTRTSPRAAGLSRNWPVYSMRAPPPPCVKLSSSI